MRDVPRGMTGRAKDEWLRLVDELITKGVLTVADMNAFEEYCRMVGEVDAYEKLIKRVGRTKAHALGYANYLLRLRTQLRQQAGASRPDAVESRRREGGEVNGERRGRKTQSLLRRAEGEASMTAAARPRKRPPSRSEPPTDGWWGNGPPPWERWIGVTIKLEGEWSAERERWESPCGRYYYDQETADKAVDFFPTFLRHHIGEFAGEPFVPMPYQELLLTRPLFGWKRVADGLRRFRKLFAFLPKGAGKSPWGAGTSLYLTLCDDEAAAEVYAVAADTKQAKIVHDNAKVMVETSPDLADMCEVLRDAIFDPASHSKLEVLSSDAATKHGFRPHAVVFDEFHAQPNADLYEALERSMIKRRQPMMIIITHAGEDDAGICYEEYELAKRVLSGTITAPTSLPVIFEASPDDDWTSPDVWRRVNPGHGITVKHEAIETECTDAQAAPRKKNGFLRYHLNRWVNDARAWMPVDWWDACQGSINDDALQGLSLAGGLDLAQKIDLAAFVVTFKQPIAGAVPSVEVIGTDDYGEPVKRSISLNYRITVVPFFWIPKDTMREHERTDRVPYSEWARLGLVRATEGGGIDYDRIYRDITGEITERFPLLRSAEIGFDPAFATDIAQKLQNDGYRMFEVLQNYKHISEPSHVFEMLVRNKRVTHDGHRVLRWNFENATVRTDDAGRIRPVKPKRATRRIDGIVATVMGVSRLMVESSSNWDVAGVDLPGA
jgi:phage terminase large subunit-like protein